jgi:GntR family transcriptional regulator / MocR family aminotransferase
VIVVSGAQQALDLIARLLLDSGDSVLVEEPSYRGAHVAFEAVAAKMIPIPVDEDGLSLSQAIARGGKARLLYTTPSHQYPLGTTMSVARRLELVNWAAQSGIWIVEDDYDSEFRYGSRPLPALQSLDRAGCVILLGTFSKVLFPALRLGYLVVPPDLAEGFVRAKAVTDFHCPSLEQAVVADFMEEGHFGRHIRRMRTLYLERLEALLEAAQAEMNGALEMERPDAGMHVLARLGPRVDDVALARAAADLGVSTMPLSSCYIGPRKASGLLLGYAGYRPQQIRLGMRKLSSVLSKHLTSRS